MSEPRVVSEGSPQGDPSRSAPTSAPTPRPTPGRLVRLAALFYGVFFVVALLWAGIAGTPLFFASEARALEGASPLRDLGAGLGVGALTIWASRLMTLRTAWGDRLARTLAAVLGRLPLASCVVLALLSGVAEEVFFRGLLQPRIGLVWASLIFGLAHFAPSRALLPWTGFSVLAGFAFGLLFEATGNLLAPMAAHVLINAVNLSWLSRDYAP